MPNTSMFILKNEYWDFRDSSKNPQKARISQVTII